jgi:hypothetical protein
VTLGLCVGRLVLLNNIGAPQEQPALARIAPHRGLKCRTGDLDIAVEGDGAERLAVFAERGLLHPECQLLIKPMDIGVGDLAQEVMQLGRHAVVVVADLRAEGTQVDQEAERVAVALGFAGHFWILTRENKKRTLGRLSQGRLDDGPRQTKRMAAQAR